MHVSVNGVRLFFDVEGAKFVPDGPVMREKPVLLMLHGGPGADHSIYRPAYAALADIAQIVYLDHRGNGRSEDGPRAGWNLAQWGDDVHAFCEALGIVDPIVLGASFGGMVALAYATRHPAHPSEANPHQHRGRRQDTSRAASGTVRALWRRGSRRPGAPPVPRGQGAYRPGLARGLAAAGDTALLPQPRDPDMGRRGVNRSEVLLWFAGPDGESQRFNFFPDLHRIQCPTLVLGGEDDPMHPIESQADIAPRCQRISCSSNGSRIAGTR